MSSAAEVTEKRQARLVKRTVEVVAVKEKGTQFDRLFVYFVMGLLIALGVSYVGVGMYTQVQHGSELQSLSLGLSYPIKILVLTGVLIIATGALVMFAIDGSSITLLQSAMGILCLTLLLQLLIGGLALVYRIDIEKKSNKMYMEMKGKFNDIQNTQVLWGEMERKNKCCGLNGPPDYKLFGFLDLGALSNWLARLGEFFKPLAGSLDSLADRLKGIVNSETPVTCYPDQDRNNKIYNTGCFHIAKTVIFHIVSIVAILSFASILVVILALVILCYFMREDEIIEEEFEMTLIKNMWNKNKADGLNEYLGLSDEEIQLMIIINQIKDLDKVGTMKVLKGFMLIENDNYILEIMRQLEAAKTEKEKMEVLKKFWFKDGLPKTLDLIMKLLSTAEDYGMTRTIEKRFSVREEKSQRRIVRDFQSTKKKEWPDLVRTHMGRGHSDQEYQAVTKELHNGYETGTMEILREYLNIDEEDELEDLTSKVAEAREDPKRQRSILEEYMKTADYTNNLIALIMKRLSEADDIGLKELIKEALGIEDEEMIDEIMTKVKACKGNEERTKLMKQYLKKRKSLQREEHEKKVRLEAERKRKEEEERKRRLEEERKRREEEERKKREEQQRKRKEEEERRRQEEEERRRKAEEEMKQLLEEERKRMEEQERLERVRIEQEEKKRKAEEEKKRKEEEERRRKEEERRRKEEEARKRREEEEMRRREEEERKRKEQEERKRKEEEERRKAEALRKYLEMKEQGTPIGILKELRKSKSEEEQINILKKYFEMSDEKELKEILKKIMSSEEKPACELIQHYLDEAEKRRVDESARGSMVRPTGLTKMKTTDRERKPRKKKGEAAEEPDIDPSILKEERVLKFLEEQEKLKPKKK